MKQSGTNFLFRSALLITNIALLGSVAADMHFGFNIQDLVFSGEQSAEARTKANAAKSANAKQKQLDLRGRIELVRESSKDVTRVQRDGSRVSRLEDGYGNSTVTRNFSNHKLLRMVVVRFRNSGERNVYVYGKNGKVKNLPARFHDRVLTASADEIASGAQIFDSQTEAERRKRRLEVLRDRVREERSEQTEVIEPQSDDTFETDYEDPGDESLIADQVEPDQ